MATKPKKAKKTKNLFSNWLVVQVKSNQERWAAKNIRNQGFRAIAPFIENDNGKEEPMFPGYIFAEGPQWKYLSSTYGCIGPVLQGGSAAYLPIKVVKPLLARLDEDFVLRLPKVSLKKGDKVLILKGPYQNFPVEYITASGRDRSKVLLTLLGNSQELEVLTKYLKPRK